MTRAFVVGHGPDRLTQPVADEQDAVAVPTGDGVRFLRLPDGPRYPGTVERF